MVIRLHSELLLVGRNGEASRDSKAFSKTFNRGKYFSFLLISRLPKKETCRHLEHGSCILTAFQDAIITHNLGIVFTSFPRTSTTTGGYDQLPFHLHRHLDFDYRAICHRYAKELYTLQSELAGAGSNRIELLK